jgi:hypothetical protein
MIPKLKFRRRRAAWRIERISSPLAQLLPCLDKLLNGSGGGKGVAINDSTLAVCAIINLANGRFAEKGEVSRDRF